jgi:hypothetical protein
MTIGEFKTQTFTASHGEAWGWGGKQSRLDYFLASFDFEAFII